MLLGLKRVCFLCCLLSFHAFAAWPDSDNDGVPDKKDACADTPTGVTVMANGCQDPNDAILAAQLSASAIMAVIEDNNVDKNGQTVGQQFINQQIDPADILQIQSSLKSQIAACNKTASVACFNNVVKSIYFDVGSAQLLSTQWRALLAINLILEQSPSLQLTIIGHTDNSGTEPLNQTLSLKRAQQVKTALIQLQPELALSKIVVKGLSSKAPVASNLSAQGRQLNRRVEFMFKAE
ncbi:OmpA family protein [Shewanella intestini]|uniref:OmpA family protein n=1 Tax=Shewanella intestini TaxID=2017544 RepID=A0ABS5HZT3_9GAMM|nr:MULTISPECIES: OmpA family protein [Shewanella]MBR9727299.1 OmpA family protein [Shewanella intestini]MRG35651.1 OmpA family protein [Shewanella sp. XMDDZSB0408]